MIDIIIPVYNTPIIDLKRCLDSINNQTYKNYKVYIIDDGSEDEVRYYLDNYIVDKNNFMVKHIKNSGVSNARNVGMKLSENKYIAFVDSDDTVEAKFLEEAFNLMEENNLDLVIGGYNEVVNGSIIRSRTCEDGLHIYDINNKKYFFDKLLSAKIRKENKEIASAPVGRIYTRVFRREVIEDIKFNKHIRISEDTLFMIDCMSKVQKIGLVNKIWYDYYQNPYSITNTKDLKKTAKNILDFIKEIDQRLQTEEDIEIKNAFRMRIFKATFEINRLLTITKDNSLKIEINKLPCINENIRLLDIDDYINVNDEERFFYKMMNLNN